MSTIGDTAFEASVPLRHDLLKSAALFLFKFYLMAHTNQINS
jgi:hypothetical protein